MKNTIIAMLLLVSVTVAKGQVSTGMMAPDILLPDTKDSTILLSSFKGKVVLIDFWASWCAPCRAAIPGVIKLYNKYKSKGFEVFAVSIDSKKAAWLNAIAQHKMRYTQVNDNGGWYSSTTAAYGINEIPTTYLLDKKGKIAGIDLEGKELENKIKQLLR